MNTSKRKTGLSRSEYLIRAYEFAARGDRLPHTKITDEQARQIRTYDRTAKQWALELGVHIRTIEKVRAFGSFSHV
jgi:hypothetical protein